MFCFYRTEYCSSSSSCPSFFLSFFIYTQSPNKHFTFSLSLCLLFFLFFSFCQQQILCSLPKLSPPPSIPIHTIHSLYLSLSLSLSVNPQCIVVNIYTKASFYTTPAQSIVEKSKGRRRRHCRHSFSFLPSLSFSLSLSLTVAPALPSLSSLSICPPSVRSSKNNK